MNILIVEDNEIFAESIKYSLRQQGNIKICNNAEDAIDEIDKNIPDVIILDFFLGEHSAMALLNELQSYDDTSKIPILLCSDLYIEMPREFMKKYRIIKILDKATVTPKELRNLL